MPAKLTLSRRWERQLDEYVRAVALSPDGARVAAGTASGQLEVSDAGRGEVQLAARVPGEVCGLAFGPGALAVASPRRVTLFALDGWRARELDLPPGAHATQLCWSSRGVLAVAAGKRVRLWQADGEALLETEAHESTVTGVAFTPDGASLVTCCYGGVRVFSLERGAPARHFAWKGSLVSLAASPDGAVVACGSQDCSVHFWRLADGDDSEMRGYPAKPTALAWSADSRWLATGGSDVVCVWSFAGEGPEGSRPRLLKGHGGLVSALQYADGLLVSGGLDGEVRAWLPDASPKPLALGTLSAEVTGLAASAHTHTLVAGDAAGLVRTWSLT
jgi:WD40 repeat protein